MAPPCILGIDLAWAPRNRSGFCRLRRGRDAWRVAELFDAPWDDEAVVAWVTRRSGDGDALVAIDAPLVVPNEEGIRACDREVNRRFRAFRAGVHPANRRILARYGGLRGEAIREGLEAAGFTHDPFAPRGRRVVEVYPHAAAVVLFGLPQILEFKARGRGRTLAHRRNELARYRDLLAALAGADPPLTLPEAVRTASVDELRGRAFKALEDRLDGILCAYLALLAWRHGRAGVDAIGSPRAGYILVPRGPVGAISS